MKRIQILAAVFAVVLITACGCKTPKLEQGGAYTTTYTNSAGVVTVSGDLALYTADETFKTAYQTLDMVFLVEQRNRDYFWRLSPSIKHTLDKIRDSAWNVVVEYTTARAAYLANPTPLGLTGINAIIAKIQQLIFAGNAALGVTTGPTATTNAPSALPSLPAFLVAPTK